jgi:hypothetical protein
MVVRVDSFIFPAITVCTWTSTATTQNWCGSSGLGVRPISNGGNTIMDSCIFPAITVSTWTSTATTQGWTAVAMSASGQYQTAAIGTGFLYISSNYGVTWTQTATSQTWQASSGVGVRSISNGGGEQWYGWIHLYFQQLRCDVDTTNRHISKLVWSSGVGVRPISNGCKTSNTFIYISSNYGVTWTPTAISQSWLPRSDVGVRTISNGGSQWWIHVYFHQLRCDVDIHRHIPILA